MEPQTEAARTWTLPETHTLLDLIQDMGFTQALTRKGYQNWEVFERLCVLLSRCNIQVSSVEVKSHWQTLKAKFLSVKRLVTMGLIRVPGIAVEFPFYEEMEQLLTPQSKTRSCKREADSSVSDLEGQNFPSSALSVSGMLSHNEGQAASSSNQEADEGAGLVREAPLGGL
ncbi:uncharacterized protein LOC142665035 isoform X2 [Rhinoderma darwinii]|uniref:uncharacterized protein LOC142665035 isoform X2 n=1 Tax=Rhinoderma darwinii TaxID=43563 RepID=UPI003F68102F